MERLRREALQRQFDAEMAAKEETLGKYKGVTLKLHEKMRGMTERWRETTREAESLHRTVDRLDALTLPLIAQLMDAVLGQKERETWEKAEREEREAAARKAGEEGKEGEEEKKAGEAGERLRGEGPHGESAGGFAAAPSASSASSGSPSVAAPSSASSLARLLSAVQRQALDVRRMKEESLGHIQQLSTLHLANNNAQSLSTELSERSRQLQDLQTVSRRPSTAQPIPAALLCSPLTSLPSPSHLSAALLSVCQLRRLATRLRLRR